MSSISSTAAAPAPAAPLAPPSSLPADLARMMSPTTIPREPFHAPPPFSTHMPHSSTSIHMTPKTAPLLPPTPQTLPLNRPSVSNAESSVNGHANNGGIKGNTLPPPTPNRAFAPPTPAYAQTLSNRDLVTPVQPRVRQPLAPLSMSRGSASDRDREYEQEPNTNIGRDESRRDSISGQSQHQPSFPHASAFATPKSIDHTANKSQSRAAAPAPLGRSLLSSPCPPIALASAARLKRQQHQQLGRQADENIDPDTLYPLQTPVSALSTRTMGRSISTPALPMTAFPLGPACTNRTSARSARSGSTRFSPSSESQRSTSRARPASQMSFSPSPTPSSPRPIHLAGIQPPANFPGPYPTAYTRKDPVPTEDGETETPEAKRSSRQGAPSWNPWDYVLGELPPNGAGSEMQTPVKDGDDGKNKIRRRFTKRELEALEVLWSISKSPSKYERQRLGAWLGVKTKHITVWFQNRRQEEKRYLREGGPSTEPPPPSRSNRGTFDPVTGKWRPVPLSCISGLQPPPEEKSAVVRAISVGDITRDMYFAQYPHGDPDNDLDESGSQTPTQQGRTVGSMPLPKRGLSNSLDEVLQAREIGFGEERERKRAYRRGSPEPTFMGEGQERIRDILSLMPSDPPSIDLAELAEDNDSENDSPTEAQEKKRKPLNALGLNHRSGPSNGLGRATSLDVIASSSRAKQLRKPNPNGLNGNTSKPNGGLGGGVLGSLNPNVPLDTRKRTLPPLMPSHSVKRARPTPTTLSTFRQKDSFSRSQSAAVLTSSPPREDEKVGITGAQMKTPGFTRSFSFSSDAAEAITPDHPTRSRVEGSVKIPKRKGDREHDQDVLGAAEILQFLGKSRV